MTRKSTSRAAVIAAASLSVMALGATSALAGPSSASTGPTTTVKPYVLPVAPGVSITSLLTVGDRPAENGYRMVGIPDGLGALPSTSSGDDDDRGRGRDRDDELVDVFMNHELVATAGAVRDHGQTGAFVSRLTVDPETGAVVAGDDLINSVRYWQYAPAAGQYGAAPVAPTYPIPPTTPGHTPQFSRFCSGALTDPGQLFNRRTGNGYDGQLYFANEETGNEGRVFSVETEGLAHQLPRLGLFSWENTLAAQNRTDTTLVMGNEDSADGQLWAYAGRKQRSGSSVDRAGLTNGRNSVFDVVDEAVSTDADFRSIVGKNKPARVDLSDVEWNQSGAAQNTEARSEGLTLNRIEDGAFDPRRPNDYYFLTTEGGGRTPDPAVGNGNVSRDGGGVWRLRFDDIERPERGGTLTLLLDGTEAPFLNKPDNMEIDERGNLLIQEDPGNNESLARIVAYRIADGARGVVAQFDRALFTSGQPGFITQDEESSGILDVSGLADRQGTFIFDAQVHRASDSPPPFNVEEVEEGQFLTMTIQSWGQVYTIRR